MDKTCLEAVCCYLGFQKKIEVFSQMNIKIDPVNAPDEWALNICKALPDATNYINPIGGKEFFDRVKYQKAGVNLAFQNIEITPYDQKRSLFEPCLSILDVMMWNDVEDIHTMLDNFTLI